MPTPRAVEQSMFPELRAHKAIGPLVPSVITGTNADLIEQVRKLGYLDGSVIDLTYGDNGGWWKRWRPDDLTMGNGTPSATTRRTSLQAARRHQPPRGSKNATASTRTAASGSSPNSCAPASRTPHGPPGSSCS